MSQIIFNWEDEIDCKFTNEKIPADSLGRTTLANFLDRHLQKYKGTSYVLNLNGDWGAGKTYFIKRWANSIHCKHPTVYFDAWANDFHNDPLVLVVSQIVEQISSLIEGKGQKEKKDKLVKSTTNLFKSVAPELSKSLVKSLLRVDIDDINGRIEETQNSGKDLENIVSAATKGLLNLHNKQADSIKDLKNLIKATLEDVITKNNEDKNKRWSPMYIFIDELDRCRPNFAIEVLEVIKHIFDIEGVVFVIATNTNELQHSIKSVYGSGFDANKYLMRFFNRTYELPAPDLSGFLSSLPSFQYIIERIVNTNKLEIIDWKEEAIIKVASNLFNALNIDLRSTAQISDRVSSVLAMNQSETGALWILVLESLRVSLPNSYKMMVNQQLSSQSYEENGLSRKIFIPLREKAKSTEYISKSETLEQHEKLYGNDFSHHVNNNRTKTPKVFNMDVSIREMITNIQKHIKDLQISSRQSQSESLIEWYMVKTHSDVRVFINYIELASHLE
ncbi:KAP family P-loop NTPase fold protein [Cognaticolwellia mytili]|uniref:KAP family P-loop NTPase fold protein n=1 Tax=Cognaticolwellia mytili TaxID=1888913 RepID=UPI000A17404A|nr:P-loop NTPase fold protein [Cognaticolwellia mytili]